MCIYLHMYIFTYTHTHIYIYTHTHTYTRIQIYMYTNKSIYVYIYTNIYTSPHLPRPSHPLHTMSPFHMCSASLRELIESESSSGFHLRPQHQRRCKEACSTFTALAVDCHDVLG